MGAGAGLLIVGHSRQEGGVEACYKHGGPPWKSSSPCEIQKRVFHPASPNEIATSYGRVPRPELLSIPATLPRPGYDIHSPPVSFKRAVIWSGPSTSDDDPLEDKTKTRGNT